ncbi:MAG: phosphotransferase family protein [Pseudomonadales bacterium]
MSETTPLNADSWPQTICPWLADALPHHTAPFSFKLVQAGGSNLTYIVSDFNEKRFVVRRPPLRARLATAHDMQREFKIMTALLCSDVPVPAMLAYCEDRSVCDVDFYCMEMVDGLVIRDTQSSKGLTAAQCLRATESLVDAQIAFHTIDLETIGLADLAKHDAYLERQLRRWKKQVDAADARSVPAFDELHYALEASIPNANNKPGLAHGDYRFDNTILNSDFEIAAVLDWELCTIGDPVADFIWSLNYWAEPGETTYWLMDPPTLNSNFPSRQHVIDLYQSRSGIDVEQSYAWYQAFSWWKQACIVEGVYARLLKGAQGGMKIAAPELVAERVDEYLVKATGFATHI